MSRCQRNPRKNQKQDHTVAPAAQPTKGGESHLRYATPTALLSFIPGGVAQQFQPQIHPSTIASVYYPKFLPSWRATQPQAEHSSHHQEATPAYMNPRPPQIMYIETSQPRQAVSSFEALPPPPNPQRQLLQMPH